MTTMDAADALPEKMAPVRVTWWRHFMKHEDVRTREEFASLVSAWEDGECSISTVDDVDFLGWMRMHAPRWSE